MALDIFINVPVGILAVVLGAKVIPKAVGREKLTGFDRIGAGLVFVGLASLSPAILSLAVVAVVTLAWFVVHELKAADPLLDFGLFRNRNFFMTN